MLVLLALTLAPSLALADSAAVADAEVACADIEADAMAPRHGAAEVPVDITPMVQFTGDCGSTDWVVLLRDPDSGEDLATLEVSVLEEGIDPIISLVLPEELEPEHTYVLQAAPSDDPGRVLESVFTTGTGTMVGMEGLPTIETLVVERHANDNTVWLYANVVPADDPDGMSTLGVQALDFQTDDRAVIVVEGSTQVQVSNLATATRGTDELCAVAVQVDGLGEVAESDLVCVEVQDYTKRGPLGCSAAAAAQALPALLAGLVGLLGLSRRRET